MVIDWEKHLKNDTYFIANLKLYMFHFHEETNGISVRKRKITKTFKDWLKTQNIGDILLKEIEIREKKGN
jgi:hypothetical protein